jgi:hypothetical protein
MQQQQQQQREQLQKGHCVLHPATHMAAAGAAGVACASARQALTQVRACLAAAKQARMQRLTLHTLAASLLVLHVPLCSLLLQQNQLHLLLLQHQQAYPSPLRHLLLPLMLQQQCSVLCLLLVAALQPHLPPRQTLDTAPAAARPLLLHLALQQLLQQQHLHLHLRAQQWIAAVDHCCQRCLPAVAEPARAAPRGAYAGW